MHVIGIIAEYNPFHNGHRYLIEEARRISGADYVVIVMSGDFVQRGVPALWDKYTRTRMALSSGADLVLELPTAAACGSAQRFSESAVRILDNLGIVDELYFGSEAGENHPFRTVSDLLVSEPPQFQKELQELLRRGISYPAARAQALAACLHDESFGELQTFLSSPNNILGLEYCTAIRKCHSPLKPVTIQRRGSAYHTQKLSEDSSFSSASAIRRMIEENSEDADTAVNLRDRLISAIPAEALAQIPEEFLTSSGHLTEDDFSEMLLYQLQRETPESLCEYLDFTGDLARRIWDLRFQVSSFSALAERAKARNFTRTQINRALLHVLLNVHTSDLSSALDPHDVRMLGFRKSAGELLSAIKKEGRVSLITQPGRSGDLHMQTDTFSANLYESVSCRKSGRPFRHEYTKEVQIF